MRSCEILKLSLLAAGAVFWSFHAKAQSHPTGGVFEPPSPPVANPFIEELRRMPIKTALPGGVSDLSLPENGGFAPNGTVYPQVTGKDVVTTYMNSLERIVALQQRNSGNNVQFPPKRFYLLRVRQATHVFHPDPPYNRGSIIWGYDGMFPGPTFMSRYGEPILVRIVNGLYFDENANPTTPGQQIPGGFGSPRISTHLHNGHTASESDGNPADFYPPNPVPVHLPQYPASIRNLIFRDHHYAMFRAGLDPRVSADNPGPNKDDGDIAETVSTLWYHDHAMDHTAENVYKGLVGFHLFFDEIDSGNENDPSPKALRLPSGEFDIPLLFQDKRFDANGQLFLPRLDSDPPPMLGILGDRFTVNGQIQPKLTVQRRKYRFRLLNAGPSRFYQFFLTKDGKDQAFIQISNDESLL
jgi:FtsP/CotA-like multicopper oxidase with cupredoxin domain